MKRRTLGWFAAVVLLASCSSGGTATAAKSVYAIGLTHAAAFTFDATGRLWIATAAYTDAGTDAVYVVDQANATPLKVIDRLHTPLGLLWYRGELFVASKDRVDAYGGLVGTTFTRRRTVVTFPAKVGELNSLVLAPDGRLLLGISAPCDDCTPASKYSATIVGFGPDGSGLRVYARGIRAPVGLTFASGRRLLVTMDQPDHLGSATPGDWLAQVTEGSNWNFPHATTRRPVAVLDKHAGVADAAMQGDDAIVAEWAAGKVLRVTPSGTVSTFVTGIKSPAAVATATDGAVFVGDWTTGIVYRVN